MVSYWNISLGQTYCSFSDLSRGPTYSYDILYSFQPWDEVAESYSQMESHCMQTGRPQWDFFSNGPREVSFNHLELHCIIVSLFNSFRTCHSDITQTGDQNHMISSITDMLTWHLSCLVQPLNIWEMNKTKIRLDTNVNYNL